MSFLGFPQRTWVALPNILFKIQQQESPYVFSILTFIARKTYSENVPETRVSYTDIERATNISRSKVVETIKYLLDAGFIVCSDQGKPGSDGAVYGLRFRSVEPVDESPKPIVKQRSEGFRDYVLGKIDRILSDPNLKTRTGRDLTVAQRKAAAVQFAFREIFGADTPHNIKTLIELVSSCGGSVQKAARFMLQNADNQFEDDEKIDEKMVGMWKARVKKLGKAGEERTGLVPDEPVVPKGRKSVLE